MSHFKGLCSRFAICHNVVGNLENQISEVVSFDFQEKNYAFVIGLIEYCFLRNKHRGYRNTVNTVRENKRR